MGWLCLGFLSLLVGPPLLYAILNLFFRRWRIRTPEEIHRKRRLAGLCITCGYDLRATPKQCPECGTVPASAKVR